MHNKSSMMSRRRFAAGFALGSVALALPMPVAALTVDQARGLIDKVVADINGIIASGKAEPEMLKDFERIFARYADVAVISRSTLGVAAKSASPAQLQAFAGAFQTYISAKYGRRFREFIGGSIEVIDAQPVKSYYEVVTVAKLAGESPFDLRWHVSDKSGKNLFFNIIIEGINLLASERSEIGAMLDQAGGNIDTLIANMKAV
jgi:phospholipid transport system substrate-binding protein